MQQINIPTFKEVIKTVCVKLNEPVMVVGQFGAGKTEAGGQAAEEIKAFLCDVRLGQYDSVDMRGFPGVDRTTGHTIWHAPSTLPFIGNDRFPDDKITLLVLDELTSASPSVFAVAYQLINERRIGEHILKPNVRILAMGNREIDKGIVNRIPMPLANRMTWYELAVEIDAWCDWAGAEGVPPIFLAFMQFRKNLLCTYDPDKPAKVVATPRTWMKAIKYYQDGMSHLLKVASMTGAIGEGPTHEFWGFHDIWQKVLPISKIIKDPMGVPLPEEAAMKYATAMSVSGSLDETNADPLYKFLVRLAPEFTVMAMTLATKRKPSLYGHKTFIDFAAKYRQVFQANA